MSSTEKKALLDLFQKEFGMSKKNSAELLLASAYLLGTGEELRNNLSKVMQTSLENFTQDQSESAISLLEEICSVDPDGNDLKVQFVSNVKAIFSKHFEPKGKWE